MVDRISCCVPFCTHTRGDRKNDPIKPDMEWLCEDHWKLVPKRLKRRRAKLRRMQKISNDPFMWARVDLVDNRVWAACKRQAIDRACGI